MTTERDDIEAALADYFDAEHLAVYADYLEGLGDPRGEIIALELRGIEDGHDDRLARWLGDDVVALLEPSTIEVGFITDLYIDDATPSSVFATLERSPIGAYIRGVTVHGTAATVRDTIARLTAGRHPWLETLAIQATTLSSGVTVPTDAPLATALPKLRELEVWGRRVFGELAHPGVRSLRVTDYEAIGSLLDDGPVGLPNVAVLDLACMATQVERVAGRLDRDRLPALRRLDLSRNEPGTTGPHYLGGRIDACELLARLPARAQLAHVRLPSVRTPEQAARLAEAMASMPALRHLTAARAYHAHRHVAVPHPLVLPAAFPWWPADAYEVGARLRFDMRGDTADVLVRPLIVWLEAAFATLPPPARDAWLHAFRLVAESPRMTLARDELIAALAVEPPVDGLELVGVLLGDADGARLSIDPTPGHQ